MSDHTVRRHRLLRWVAIAVVVLAIGVVGGPFVYIHFIETPAPKPLALPSTAKTHPAGRVPFPSGVWHATSASDVGYRVHEVLFGQNNTAVGRTHAVRGSITLADASVTKGSFTVQMATVHSDQTMRDNQFDGRIMNVTQFPTATFTLSSPIALGARTKAGTTITATATGELTLHGVTHRVTFPVMARYTSAAILINGSIPVTFSDYGISDPGFVGISVDPNGSLEFLFTLHPGAA